MRPIEYPLGGNPPVVSNSDRLREVAPAVADAFTGLRAAATAHSTLTEREQELVLLAGFAATRNEGGFRVHCHRAVKAGFTRAELEQVVLLMLGTNVGLAPSVQTLVWLDEELA